MLAYVGLQHGVEMLELPVGDQPDDEDLRDGRTGGRGHPHHQQEEEDIILRRKRTILSSGLRPNGRNAVKGEGRNDPEIVHKLKVFGPSLWRF